MNLNRQNGFGLIEVTIIIITIGILASIAMQSMTVLITDARQVKTEREMELLADAIIGNADISAGNQRGDFGYIGDVGSFPPNLDALITNPGGYTTWDGPYISTQFTQDTDGYKTDEWGNAYTYTGGLTISSNGSGTIITKKIADATSDYTINNFNGTVLDASGTTPSTIYRDSININITIPNGLGGTTTKSYLTNSSGVFTLDSLPVGQHPLQIIYTPNVDTLYSILTILPRHKSNKTFKFASSYFTSSSSSSNKETLRPNGTGAAANLLTENCSTGWQCVDEATSDGDGSFVKGSGDWKNDTYATQNSSIGAGTIDSIKIFINSRKKTSRTAIRTYNTLYESGDIAIADSYTNYSTTYSINPNTGIAWTWTEIDALEIGVSINGEGFCTQVWIDVYYTN